MKPFDDILKKVKDVFNLLSGRSERELQRLKQETEDLQKKVKQTMVEAADLTALSEFRTRRAAEYFTTRAVMEPDQGPTYRRLAELAATVDLGKMRGDINAYGPGEEKNREWHVIKDRYKDEINGYASSRIQEFIDADPKRWERMKTNSPALTAKLKPSTP